MWLVSYFGAASCISWLYFPLFFSVAITTRRNVPTTMQSPLNTHRAFAIISTRKITGLQVTGLLKEQCSTSRVFAEMAMMRHFRDINIDFFFVCFVLFFPFVDHACYGACDFYILLKIFFYVFNILFRIIPTKASSIKKGTKIRQYAAISSDNIC